MHLPNKKHGRGTNKLFLKTYVPSLRVMTNITASFHIQCAQEDQDRTYAHTDTHLEQFLETCHWQKQKAEKLFDEASDQRDSAEEKDKHPDRYSGEKE